MCWNRHSRLLEPVVPFAGTGHGDCGDRRALLLRRRGVAASPRRGCSFCHQGSQHPTAHERRCRLQLTTMRMCGVGLEAPGLAGFSSPRRGCSFWLGCPACRHASCNNNGRLRLHDGATMEGGGGGGHGVNGGECHPPRYTAPPHLIRARGVSKGVRSPIPLCTDGPLRWRSEKMSRQPQRDGQFHGRRWKTQKKG